MTIKQRKRVPLPQNLERALTKAQKEYLGWSTPYLVTVDEITDTKVEITLKGASLDDDANVRDLVEMFEGLRYFKGVEVQALYTAELLASVGSLDTIPSLNLSLDRELVF